MTARRLVSSERGAIDHVLYAVPAAFLREAPDVADAMAAALASGVSATVLTHAGAAVEVRRRMPAGSEVVVVPDEAALSVWIQDQSLAFEGEGGATALLAGDRLPAAVLPVTTVEGLVPIDGGNLLVGADYVLVGRDELAFWAARRRVPPPEEEAAALAAFAEDYGLPERSCRWAGRRRPKALTGGRSGAARNPGASTPNPASWRRAAGRRCFTWTST